MATDDRNGQRLHGPVAITGADGHIGRALRQRMVRSPNLVRPLRRADDWVNPIASASAVIHLAGTLQPRHGNTYDAANVVSLKRVLHAAADSSVRRLVLLSYVGADPNASNAYLRTKGAAEQLALDAGVDTVVLRSTLVHGDVDDIGPSFAPYQARPGGSALILGDGAQLLAPIHVGDLANLLLAAAVETATPTGVHEVAGGVRYTMDEFVRAINPPGVALRHMPAAAARLIARVVPQLTPALVDVMTSDSLPATDPLDTARRFGVTLRNAAINA